MNARALLLALCLAGPGLAQGFADLGQGGAGFAQARRRALEFPADHGAHPDFRIEWWYLTASLTGADGRDYGAQWTLFRSALAPGEAAGWASPQLWMGHAAVTSADTHLVAEKLARGGIGQAGVLPAPFAAWIDDWQMRGRPTPGVDALAGLELSAAGEGFAYALTLEATGPVVAQGEAGYSVKSAQGQASHYYSQPFYRVAGNLTLGGERVAVKGEAWLDHEWSSQPLATDQTGWDWFALQLDGGARLMAFRLRGGGAAFVSGTWIDANGSPTMLPPGALTLSPLDTAAVAGRELAVAWRLAAPARGLDVVVQALNPQAWMATSVPYWEGPIRVSGSHKGRGYLEMTGY